MNGIRNRIKFYKHKYLRANLFYLRLSAFQCNAEEAAVYVLNAPQLADSFVCLNRTVTPTHAK